MYKEKVDIKTYDNELQTVNIETIGKRVGCYRYYFRCVNCKNQSIFDDDVNDIHACINRRVFIDVITKKFIAKIIEEERTVSNEIIRSL